MPTLPNMPLVLPVDGNSTGQWGALLNAIMTVLDTHRHEGIGSGGLKIRPAGMDINANLSMAGFGLTNIGQLAFQAVAALAAGSKVLFVSSSDNELYWRTSSGTNVKLTNGAALNVSAFTGGIGGDYSAIGALLDYDDATDSYRFRQEVAASVRQYAKIRAGDLQLFEYKAAGAATVPTNAVTLKSPAALAAGYSVTWPAAVPGSTQLVQMSSAGVLTASNTVANLLTASSGVACAVDQHVTVSGTGRHKHGDDEITISAAAFQPSSPNYAATVQALVDDWTFTGGPPNDVIRANVPLPVGKRIKSILWHFNKASQASAMVMKLRKRNGTTNTDVDTLSDTSSGASYTTSNRTGIDYTIASGDAMTLVVSVGHTAHRFSHAVITFDHP